VACGAEIGVLKWIRDCGTGFIFRDSLPNGLKTGGVGLAVASVRDLRSY
jgi:hypothetical protein